MKSDSNVGMLLSETIMAELERAAIDSKRGQKRLETLNRLKTACDDIASGKAADYADKVGADSTLFKIQPRRINSVSVGEYIKIRRQTAKGQDGAKLWPGPNASTLRADENLKKYLDARRIEANGFQKKRHPNHPRARSVEAIISKIPDQGDRHLIMTEIEKGRAAQRKLRLAVEAVPKLWAVDLDAVIDGSAAAMRGSASELTDDDRLALRRLLMKLTSNAELRQFDLIYDKVRVKMSDGTGAALISKDELALLRSLAKVGA
ncbi:hypothetical protein [Afipia felis]|uniref:Uncharacterized protein n=2 Tax=Afipia felis TaxID=1035 RepID=A0A380W4T5_AFIFE|nr:hypothetical protein [Afipia felis]EKS31065.1 hypothetical protein HMPREF9697_03593 [Afipia felis ATCC 53690]SUU75809.1 Uncharacterised protein [Afipia felis]SUU83876.1 Uncharacterised protein [Afipia felis]